MESRTVQIARRPNERVWHVLDRKGELCTRELKDYVEGTTITRYSKHDEDLCNACVDRMHSVICRWP